MKPLLKPIVVISKCLGFNHCRYNGQIISVPFIDKLKEYVEFKPVCPEVEIGLGVPRDPVRIIMEGENPTMYQPATQKDVMDIMNRFITEYMSGMEEVDGFILKNRSPSCGIHDVKIYTGFDKKMSSKKGSGFFGGTLMNHFPDCPIEDEDRLTNFAIREHFLTQLFTFRRFRQVKMQRKMQALVEFQSQHKYLLLAYNESQYRRCGQIVANREKYKFDTVVKLYEQALRRVFKKMSKYKSMINALMHLFGGISKYLSVEEKRFFLNSIEEYRDERIPLSTVNHLLHAYAIRFHVHYLLNQLFLNPYPRELVIITDSGKGRNY